VVDFGNNLNSIAKDLDSWPASGGGITGQPTERRNVVANGLFVIGMQTERSARSQGSKTKRQLASWLPDWNERLNWGVQAFAIRSPNIEQGVFRTILRITRHTFVTEAIRRNMFR
jgi:hypothetical protein